MRLLLTTSRNYPRSVIGCSQLHQSACTSQLDDSLSIPRLSKMLFPTNPGVVGREKFVSLSHRVFLQRKLMQQTAPGLFTLSPLLLRSLQKLKTLIRKRMNEIEAQEIQCSVLSEADLWRTSGRWHNWEEHLLTGIDRNNQTWCLQPTHEEMCTFYMQSHSRLSQDTTMLYQIGSKFRDELQPRYGLLRAREFIMKDLYSFSQSAESCRDAYEKVQTAYDKLFVHDLQLPVIKCLASSGGMGGTQSHEYHLEHPAGQDTLIRCTECKCSFNTELLQIQSHNDEHNGQINKCPECHANIEVDNTETKTFEIAHTFLLGTKYTDAFAVKGLNNQALHMACFGIGLGRLLAASIDTLTKNESTLIWPTGCAPFECCVVGPKFGSKEEAIGSRLAESLVMAFTKLGVDCVLDDRGTKTIGRRLNSLRLLGVPWIVVCGSNATNQQTTPTFELIHTPTDTVHILTHRQLMQRFA